MNLEELSIIEDELHGLLLTGGTDEEKIAHIKSNDIPARWQGVLDGYIELFPLPEYGDEALRRAIFLIWCSYNEPAFQTGFGELSFESEQAVLQAVETQLATSCLDVVTQAMLHDYGPGLPFELHPDLFRLNLHLAKDAFPIPARVAFESMENRGAMGRYWKKRLAELDSKNRTSNAGPSNEQEAGGDSTTANLDEEIEQELPADARAACTTCGTPVDPSLHYCPVCQTVTGTHSDYIPYVNINHNASAYGRIFKRNWNNDEPTTATRWVRRLPIIMIAIITSPAWLPIFLVGAMPYLIWDRLQSRKQASENGAPQD